MLEGDDRELLQGRQEVELFLKNICDHDWNLKHDSGQLFSKGILEKSKKYPEYSELIHAWYKRWEEMLGGPIDESVQVLSELKEKGVLLYILSNWSAETYPIKAWLASLQIIFPANRPHHCVFA